MKPVYAIKDALFFLIKSGHSDLTLRQISVLLACSEEEKMVRNIAAELHISKPVVSRSATKLEAMKFMNRRIDKKDRRSVWLSLTLKGKIFASNFS